MSAKKSSKAAADYIASNRQDIVDKFVSMLGDPTLDWVKQWSGSNLNSPYNPCSGSRYNGGNRLYLTMVSAQTGDPRFCTYNQAVKRGWQVRKGCHGYHIEKFGTVRVYERDEDGNVITDADGNKVIKFKFAKPIATYTVFNFTDIDGVPELTKQKPMTHDEMTVLMDAFIETSDCPIIEGESDRAYYSPLFDDIHAPSRHVFTSSTAALHTLLHEMGHSTGHSDRLAREGIVGFNGFGSEKYAFEELVTELSSVFTASYVHADAMQSVEHRRNHAAYLKSWLGALADNPDYLFKAASKAEAASDFIIERLVAVHPEYEMTIDAIPEVTDTDGIAA